MTSIKKIKRKDLNLEMYSNAINRSLNYRVYAEYWFLDLVTDKKWECLIYGEYQVVMPIPLQYKFGFKFVLQPNYCQQLGVFYNVEIDEKLFRIFEKELHRYRVRAYSFNEENTERFKPEGAIRNNYLLNLNRPFEEIFSDFRKDRKKDFRLNSSLGLKIEEKAEVDFFIETFQNEYPDLKNKLDFEKLKFIVQTLIGKGKYRPFTLYNSLNQPIATLLLLKSGNRLIIHFSVRAKENLPKGATAYMRGLIIKQLSEKSFILDFEGSMIQGVALFNESFGAEKISYTMYSNLKFLSGRFLI